MAELIPSLARLRSDFNTTFPGRSTESDGWIGDPRHAASSSDHNPDETGNVPVHDADHINEVHAIDVDKNLNDPHVTMEMCIKKILATPRDLARLRYIIFKPPGKQSTIWSASWGWRGEAYDGSNPHDHHAHFSGRYDTGKEQDDAPWSITTLKEPDMEKSDPIALKTDGEVKYSGSSTTVEGVLSSTNYYMLVVRNRVIALQAELSAMHTIMDKMADALVACDGNVDMVAVRAELDKLRADVRDIVDTELDEAFTGGADRDV